MIAGTEGDDVTGTGSKEPEVPIDEPAEPAGEWAGASPEDAELVGRLLRGHEESFVALVGRYHGPLIRLALAFVADRVVAEEVVQETWLAVLNGLRSFEGRSSLKTWIFRILTNKAKTRGWRERRTVPFSRLMDADASDQPSVDPSRFKASGMWAAPPDRWGDDTPENALLRREARAHIEEAIAALPLTQRAVVTLRDVEGLDSAAVCHILDLSEANQRVLLHRGRSRLRAALESYIGGPPLSASRTERTPSRRARARASTRSSS
ncbi:MAG: sigma-70 family RNA polymerase sigma factor [Acidobacteria bacterium]|nr:sigma-70 family RNA polymerase sigma factor [Acidobacteriota bacterium]